MRFRRAQRGKDERTNAENVAAIVCSRKRNRECTTHALRDRWGGWTLTNDTLCVQDVPGAKRVRSALLRSVALIPTRSSRCAMWHRGRQRS